ncbi:MAG: hypothetical protein ACK4R3_01610 [Aliihoeflea sp.]
MISIILLLAVLLFTFISLALATGRHPFPAVVRASFDVLNESSVWTWLNVTILSCAAGLFFLIGWLPRTINVFSRLPWIGIGTFVLMLSVDDLADFHGKLGTLGRALGGGEGLLTLAWIVPGSIIAVAMIMGVWLIARNLPRRTVFLVVSGFCLFLSVAIGFEMVQIAVTARFGHGVLFVLAYHVEEFLEGFAAVVLFYAAAQNLEFRCSSGKLSIGVIAQSCESKQKWVADR